MWWSLISLLSQTILWLRISKNHAYRLITNKTIHLSNLILKAWSLNPSLLTLSTIPEYWTQHQSMPLHCCIAFKSKSKWLSVILLSLILKIWITNTWPVVQFTLSKCHSFQPSLLQIPLLVLCLNKRRKMSIPRTVKRLKWKTSLLIFQRILPFWICQSDSKLLGYFVRTLSHSELNRLSAFILKNNYTKSISKSLIYWWFWQ